MYLPMIPELPIAMLACARIGAIQSIVFGGFSAESLKDRILDAEAKILITSDGSSRRGRITPLKAIAEGREQLGDTTLADPSVVEELVRDRQWLSGDVYSKGASSSRVEAELCTRDSLRSRAKSVDNLIPW
jgi:acetyl-CoA synthetase